MGVRNNPWVFLSVLLFFCFSFNTHLCFGASTITANQSLSGDQTIVSDGGIFKLGFYNPGNSSNYYICMWYAQVSTLTVVWVANTEKPISDRYSSELKIINGNLVLLNESQIPIWSTKQISMSSNSVVAVLLDNGNLVLRESHNSTQPIWQSFDHPVHTFLPGNKIAYNKITNTHQQLTSWKNTEDPSPGPYTLNLDANNSQYLIMWNGSERYWTSGAWNGQIFSLVPEMRANYIFNFSYVDNENESYFTYSLYNPAIISRFIIDVSGQVKQLTWLEGTKEWNLFWAQPRQQCEVYAYCGAFGTCNENTLPFCNCLQGFHESNVSDWNLSDYSAGCVRNTPLQQCGNTGVVNGQTDRFWEYSNMRLPDYPQSVFVGSDLECESACLNSCSCTAYAYGSDGCSIWTENLLNLQQLSGNDGSGKTLYLRLAASEFPVAKNKKGAIIGPVAASVGGVLLLGLVLAFVWKRQRRFVAKTKAVDGTLPDSSVIAVKKLENISQGEKQFRTEVSTIGTIQHVNLVRLRGLCSEGSKRLVVYDYMQNSSLDAHLFNKKESQIFDWQTRYQIALGTARGLAYLHEKCWDCIIHCNIKPENILLDTEFCPKVADFGLAKLMGHEFSRVVATMRGTQGYLAPEWISGVAKTAKADVYSYGMVLFELVSGRRNSEQTQDGRVRFFPTWAVSVVIEGGNILDLLDPKLHRNADSEELKKICRVAVWCIQDDENHRPTMGQIVKILEGVLDVNPPPIPRSLQAFIDNQEHIVFFRESDQSSEAVRNPSSSDQSKSTTSTMSS
ncbi:hypothetical protein TEA_029938 [Camellia sinensis var. sinensis]|uniref:Receptor-like serine/threonine-protein kinase n=1 Tax=Camellia sinensis var. sinensis TaxID=542762 RepID=A0A4S4EHL0_CAMSN|nr:hypothetical protein TEA_029938 [Camellia sinensis var. sinensis]